MKKWIWSVPMTLLLSLSLLACSGDVNGTSTPSSSAADSGFDSSKEIMVVSREEGSGTRGAFVELFGVEVKNDQGEKEDMTTEEADISNSTNVVMTTVANNEDAIGYISLGSLNDTVKAVKINDAEPTVDNIKSGDYKIARPFNIAVMGQVSDAAQDFIDFIMSADGQKVIEESGYIPVSDQPSYNGSNPGGKITVGGSSSVTPVMEKLKEAYLAVNPNADIEIQLSDSTTGMTSAIDGICDIGMASRELKESELEKGLEPTVIAMDGIAVVVNENNPVDNMTIEQVRSIYTGETTVWSGILE